MTVQQIFDLAIDMGKTADPRGKVGIAKALKRTATDYQALSAKEKSYFDAEALVNPYADSRLLFGDPSTVVNKVLAGIDIQTGEVVLADRLNEKGEGIDLIIGHHPHGRALSALDEVMDLQVDMLELYGVPINVAEGMMKERIAEVYRHFAPRNHFQSVDAARLLNLPFMCVHTPTDNLGWRYLADLLEKKDFDNVGEVLTVLDKVEEFIIAKKQKAGPMIFVGSPRARAGRVRVVEFTGGTEGAKEIYSRLSQAGVGTIIGMHVSEEHRKEAQKHHMNLVVTGHMASDSIGMNLLLDALESKGVNVLPCSGLIRVKRN